MLKSGSCYIEMDEGCEIILSTWKDTPVTEKGLECIPIMHI